MRKKQEELSCEGQPPTLTRTLWYWFNRENRSWWIMMSWLNALLASVTEGGRGAGWVGGGGWQFEGKEEWRSVNERLRKTGRDKADELEFYLNCSWEGSQFRVGCYLREGGEGRRGGSGEIRGDYRGVQPPLPKKTSKEVVRMRKTVWE